MSAQFSKTHPPIDVEILRLSHEGRGVGRLENGKTVFIEGALPGESVRVAALREQARFAEAEASVILRPSPQRVNPRCPVASICGGCSLQHLDPAAHLAHKRQSFLDTLERLGRWTPENLKALNASLECLTLAMWEGRQRCRVRVTPSAMGFFRKGSQEVIPWPNSFGCVSLLPALNAALQSLQPNLVDLSRKANATLEIEATWAQGSGSLCLELVGVQPLQEKASSKTGAAPHRERHKPSPSLPPRLALEVQKLGPASKELRFETKCGALMQSPRGFLQPHVDALDCYQNLILDFCKDISIENGAVWDLYCGAGALTLALQKAFPKAHITGVEGVEEAMMSFAQNLPKATACVGDVRDALEQGWPGISHPRLVLWDPPRSGVGPDGARALIPHLDRKTPLIWVSCDPASFARDVEPFLQAGMRPTRCVLVDAFPQTPHFETITRLEWGAPPT